MSAPVANQAETFAFGASPTVAVFGSASMLSASTSNSSKPRNSLELANERRRNVVAAAVTNAPMSGQSSSSNSSNPVEFEKKDAAEEDDKHQQQLTIVIDYCDRTNMCMDLNSLIACGKQYQSALNQRYLIAPKNCGTSAGNRKSSVSNFKTSASTMGIR